MILECIYTFSAFSQQTHKMQSLHTTTNTGYFSYVKNVVKGNKETDLKSNEFSFYEIKSNLTLIIIY